MVVAKVEFIQILLQVSAPPMMVRSKHATSHKPEESFDGIRRDVFAIFATRILLLLVVHQNRDGKIIMDEVVDHCRPRSKEAT